MRNERCEVGEVPPGGIVGRGNEVSGENSPLADIKSKNGKFPVLKQETCRLIFTLF